MAVRGDPDFLTEEQRMIRDAARDFAQAELAPNAARGEEEGWVPDAVVAKLGELGFLGMTVPPEWGGSGADYLSYILAVEEVAAGCAATSTIMSVHNGLGCGLVLAWGAESQKRKWLPTLAAGKAMDSPCSGQQRQPCMREASTLQSCEACHRNNCPSNEDHYNSL